MTLEIGGVQFQVLVMDCTAYPQNQMSGGTSLYFLSPPLDIQKIQRRISLLYAESAAADRGTH